MLFFFLFFFTPLFLFFLSLLAWADICTAELATWGVGPDVVKKKEKQQCHPTPKELSLSVRARKKKKDKSK